MVDDSSETFSVSIRPRPPQAVRQHYPLILQRYKGISRGGSGVPTARRPSQAAARRLHSAWWSGKAATRKRRRIRATGS